MRNYFIFGGIDSRDLGVYISGEGVYNSPSRTYNPIVIPGRNGDLLGYETRLENVELTYPAFCYGDLAAKMAAIKSALLSLTGYQRLADTYYPDEYRLAYYAGGMDVEATNVHDAGEFELVFVCKPQRYLISGEQEVTVSSGGTLENPSPFKSSPIITATGYGVIEIGSQVITVLDIYDSVTINSDIMDCYSGLTNANDAVSFSGNDFPVLSPGINNITFDNTITEVKIIPNWWRV